MIDVTILGAAGYAGAELTRLVLGHPDMRLVAVTSSADAGRRVDDVYPALAGCDLAYVGHEEGAASAAGLVFLAVPHTAAMAVVPSLLDAGATVVDASADFRLKDAAAYEEWYGVAHTAPHLLEAAVYGLPELGMREALASAKLVACPGCYPTASLLAIAPALEAGIAEADGIVIDAKSGVSGAGRTPTAATHFASANESLAPYKVAEHRHTPEIEQELSRVAGRSVAVTFVPHLIPMTRGMLVTAYLRAGDGAADAAAVYGEAYAGEPFITVHEAGRMPATAEVRGGNRAHIGVKYDAHSGVLVVACAIDNLVKGTSGQAVQCANLALGLDETAGLTCPVPVV